MRIILTLVFLVGCSDGVGQSGVEASAPTIAFPLVKSVEDVLDAELAGVLEVDGDCPYAIRSFDGRRYLLLLPEDDTAWDEATGMLALYGIELVDGNAVSLGGYGREDRPEGVDVSGLDIVNPPAPECDQTNIWYVHSARVP